MIPNEAVSIGAAPIPEAHVERACAKVPGIQRRSAVSWMLDHLANTIFSMGVVSMYYSMWVRSDPAAPARDVGFLVGEGVSRAFLEQP